MLKIVKCNMPDNFKEDYTDEELTEYDLKDLSQDIEELYYWYGGGSYCGTGNAVYKTQKGRWEHAGLSHCSCNGPTDGLDVITGHGYDTWQELVSMFSGELLEECASIIEALKSREEECKAKS